MSTQTTPNLLTLPTLYLDGHTNTNDFTDDQGAVNVNAPVATPRRYVHILKSHFDQEYADQLLKSVRSHREQLLMKFLPYATIVMLNFSGKAYRGRARYPLPCESRRRCR